jgi:uncharacterized membrane protein
MDKTRVHTYLDKLRSTYWFLPLVMTACAAILAIALFKIDGAIPDSFFQNQWFILQGDKVAARTLLGSVATTLLGVMGIVFSVTLVPLTISASQFGGTVMRTFARDVPTQIVLGTYSSTIIYCLLLTLRVSFGAPDASIPQLSATFGMLLFILCLGLLIYFISHVADLIRVTRVITIIRKELIYTIQHDFLLPEQVNKAQHARNNEKRITILEKGQKIPANKTGYIIAFDFEELICYAYKIDCVIYVKNIAGDFVTVGDALYLVWPPNKHDRDILTEELNKACIVGEARTMVQDVRFGLNQIVQIASRALSPGVNDPVTPLLCIDSLTSSLCLIAERDIPNGYYYDNENQLRLINEPVSFKLLVEAAFSHIRQYGRGTTEVLIRLLEAMKAISFRVRNEADRSVLLQQAQLIEIESRDSLPSEYDRQRVELTYNETINAINISNTEVA